MDTTTHPPVHELLDKRWSPRAFDADRPLTGMQVRSLLEAARKAPSAFNEQPWRFIVGTREHPEEFAKVLSCLVPGNQIWAQHAGALMIVVTRSTFTHNDKPNKWAYHDIGLAIMSMMIQAEHLGLSAHAMAGFDADKTRAEFSIPEGFEPVTAIAFGYMGDLEKLPDDLKAREKQRSPRRPLEESVLFGHI